MYRMVVTDLDGTLLNNKKQVSEANVKAIQNLKDQNITFVMATGRSDVMTRAYTKQLKMSILSLGVMELSFETLGPEKSYVKII